MGNIADEKGIHTCAFCGLIFDQYQGLGTSIICPNENDGGCGREFRLMLISKPIKDNE